MSAATATVAAIRAGWLSTSLALPGRARNRSTPRILNVLAWNAVWPAGAGVVVDPDGRYRASLDIPAPEGGLDEGRHAAAAAAVAEVAEGFPAVLMGRAAPEIAETRAAPGEEETDALLRAAADAEWPAQSAEGGEITFSLESTAGSAVARAVPFGTGWRLVAALGALGTGEPVRHRAVACFLFGLTAGLRMVRAALVPSGGSPLVRLQVALPARPCAPALAAALSALSVAHRHARAETRALLASTELARAYLESRGWSEGRSRANPDSQGGRS